MKQKAIPLPIDFQVWDRSCYTTAIGISTGICFDAVSRGREVKKRIAVLVRERQAEALRMAVGLTLRDDEVNVYVMDRKLDDDPKVGMNVEVLGDLHVKIYTNNAENSFEFMSTEEIAKALVSYDTVLPY
jgi:hypothetical protein